MSEIEKWSIEKSRELYGVENWGDGYFDINESGNISVHPRGRSEKGVDLFDLV